MTNKLTEWQTTLANIKTNELCVGYYTYKRKLHGRDKKATALRNAMWFIEREKKPYPLANDWAIYEIYITTDNRVVTYHIGIDKI